MTSRKKPGVTFWATVAVVVLLVAYPLSFGPACWISSRTGGEKTVSTVYRPVMNICDKTAITKSVAFWYSNLMALQNWHWIKVDWDDPDSPPRWRWATADF